MQILYSITLFHLFLEYLINSNEDFFLNKEYIIDDNFFIYLILF